MSVAHSLEKESISISRFLDWCKYKNIFYNNYYLEEYKIVIKVPLTPQTHRIRKDIKIKKFDLTKYTYLLSY